MTTDPREGDAGGRWGRRSWFLRASSVALGLFVLGLLTFSLQSFLSLRARGVDIAFVKVLAGNAPGLLSWGMVAPLIVLLARHLRYPGTHFRWLALGHILGMATVAPVKTQLRFTLGRLLETAFPWADVPPLWELLTFRQFLLVNALDTPVLYSIIVALVWRDIFLHEKRESEFESARLVSSLAQTRLDEMTRQIQPALLLEALNKAAERLPGRPDESEELLVKLADYLRESLHYRGETVAPLAAEVSVFRRLATLQGSLMDEEVPVQLEIDPDLIDAPVPIQVLRPFLLAVLRYRWGCGDRGGAVHVAARGTGRELVITVRPGCTSGCEGSNGELDTVVLNGRDHLRGLFAGHATIGLAIEGDSPELTLRVPRIALARMNALHEVPAAGRAPRRWGDVGGRS